MANKKTSTETSAPIKKKVSVEAKVPQWEVRDRAYFLKDNKQPLVFTIPTRHSTKKPLLWFDEDASMQRELRYATNMNSPFVDEQKGEATLGRVVFREGQLFVPKQEVALQKLLSLYHPLRDQLYYEYNPVQESVCNNFSDTGVTGLRAVWLIHLLLMFPTLLVVLFVVYNIYYNELLLCSHCYQCYYYYEQSLFVLLSVLLLLIL